MKTNKFWQIWAKPNKPGEWGKIGQKRAKKTGIFRQERGITWQKMGETRQKPGEQNQTQNRAKPKVLPNFGSGLPNPVLYGNKKKYWLKKF